jgi:hypothetical protein
LQHKVTTDEGRKGTQSYEDYEEQEATYKDAGRRVGYLKAHGQKGNQKRDGSAVPPIRIFTTEPKQDPYPHIRNAKGNEYNIASDSKPNRA